MAFIRSRPREQVMQHRAKRVDVAPGVHSLTARLLRGHVRRGSKGLPHDREIVCHHILEAFFRIVVRVLALFAENFGKPPINHDDFSKVSYQNVVGLEIAMDNAATVGIGQSFSDRGELGQQRDALT